MAQMMTESRLNIEKADCRKVIQAGDYWMGTIQKGESFRILDLEGNQAVDTLFFSAEDPREAYSAQLTLQFQKSIYLTTGSRLISNQGRTLLTIVADTCGRHDTLGGACSAESNSFRYPQEKRYMHSCRDSFIQALQSWEKGFLTKRHLPPNINFFMNVPVTPEGQLTFEDGVSAPGKYVEMIAEMDVLCLISNCPQLNNPCNAYHPTPVEVMIWKLGAL
jgi:hypothetical protein